MGIMTLIGFMNDLTGYLSGFDGLFSRQTESVAEDAETPTNRPARTPEAPAESHPSAPETESGGDAEIIPAPDFTMTDQNGAEHTLSDYQGKTVFLNFWATWCPPCRSEMPEIQTLYEEFGYNEGELVVLGVAAPEIGQEGDEEHIAAFLSENGYTFPVVMDVQGIYSYLYGIRAYPTTFMISADGSVYGYVEGALTGELMRSIVEQTMEAAGD